MKYAVLVAPEAIAALDGFRAYERAAIKDALQELQRDPTRVGKSRIKRLRGLQQPQYRLRVGDVRVFYDVEGDLVNVLAILTKKEALAWLELKGKKS